MSRGNTSSAVMQQRREPHDSLDDFPTPPWGTRALCEYIARYSEKRLGELSVREPAANRGYMVRPLSEYFGAVIASDVHDYGAGYKVQDYLFGPDSHFSKTDWTITNPPFRLAEQFIERALATSRVGCAVILRSAFLEGIGRYERLFGDRPSSHVLQFVERIPMVKGRLDSEAASATSYAWLVWFKQRTGPTILDWIPPCRKHLERPEDYK